jgi:hypothetical protein
MRIGSTVYCVHVSQAGSQGCKCEPLWPARTDPTDCSWGLNGHERASASPPPRRYASLGTVRCVSLALPLVQTLPWRASPETLRETCVSSVCLVCCSVVPVRGRRS